ncbi:hypothetical protein ACFOY8_12940 [Thalassospira xianhensis]|uniref:Restriction endonuclease n=2 Tax=Thalassospira TaxID=168934 RepID=A0A285TTK1_9PROT|nr:MULTISPECIES: hypothetical protein [Thalassospira]RCK07872.1 hypothetical protein TH5_02350 [Thalassospira xianhensis MCCC 1A02616]SOC27296.1 hypothetical protein SAMN05428964_105357 [Thalassospira xiamenensis]
MSAFHANSRFESDFTARLIPAIKPLLAEHNLGLTVMGRAGEAVKHGLDKSLQQEVGDFIVTNEATGSIVHNVDLKVERRTSFNLFFETFSNATLNPEKVRLGWGAMLKADRLWYAFDDINMIAVIDLHKLREWLNEKVDRGRPRFTTLREVCQSAHKQQNITMGRLVPFSSIPVEIWKSSILLNNTTASFVGRDEFLRSLEAHSFKRSA